MKKLLSDMKTHPTKSGGTLKITGPRDRENRCQFVIEWEDKTPHCEKCGARPGEGYPVPCGDGPVCGRHTDRAAAGVLVCDGKMTKRRAQVFFAQPERYVDA